MDTWKKIGVQVFPKNTFGYKLIIGKKVLWYLVMRPYLFLESMPKDSFEVIIQKREMRLTLKAKQKNPVALVSPERGEMKSYIKESLEGCLELTLEIKNQPMVTLTSERASIDVHF